MDLNEGNVSTVGVMLWTVLAPFISGYVGQDVFLALFGLLVVVWSAYNPNTLAVFGNNVKSSDVDETSDDGVVDYTVEEEPIDDDVDVVVEDLG